MRPKTSRRLTWILSLFGLIIFGFSLVTYETLAGDEYKIGRTIGFYDPKPFVAEEGKKVVVIEECDLAIQFNDYAKTEQGYLPINWNYNPEQAEEPVSLELYEGEDSQVLGSVFFWVSCQESDPRIDTLNLEVQPDRRPTYFNLISWEKVSNLTVTASGCGSAYCSRDYYFEYQGLHYHLYEKTPAGDLFNPSLRGTHGLRVQFDSHAPSKAE